MEGVTWWRKRHYEGEVGRRGKEEEGGCMSVEQHVVIPKLSGSYS